MDCIVPKAENSNEREYNYLPTMVPSFSSFIEQKEPTVSSLEVYSGDQRTVANYDAKGNVTFVYLVFLLYASQGVFISDLLVFDWRILVGLYSQERPEYLVE